jgi:hypothetical protein
MPTLAQTPSSSIQRTATGYRPPLHRVIALAERHREGFRGRRRNGDAPRGDAYGV